MTVVHVYSLRADDSGNISRIGRLRSKLKLEWRRRCAVEGGLRLSLVKAEVVELGGRVAVGVTTGEGVGNMIT